MLNLAIMCRPNSSKPTSCMQSGAVHRVTVYPSDYGLQRMADEAANGPKVLRLGWPVACSTSTKPCLLERSSYAAMLHIKSTCPAATHALASPLLRPLFYCCLLLRSCQKTQALAPPPKRKKSNSDEAAGADGGSDDDEDEDGAEGE
eukprot:scaffold44711_cov21-Tisochrysis_lutea.AAC.7